MFSGALRALVTRSARDDFGKTAIFVNLAGTSFQQNIESFQHLQEEDAVC